MQHVNPHTNWICKACHGVTAARRANVLLRVVRLSIAHYKSLRTPIRDWQRVRRCTCGNVDLLPRMLVVSSRLCGCLRSSRNNMSVLLRLNRKCLREPSLQT